MVSMQYNIKLPADYDMEVIKKRVKDNGNKTDGFPDLEMKAYLIAEKAKHSNQYNEYAPFYLWRSDEGMNSFLTGGPFNNILGSFGWVSVSTWQVLHSTIHKTSEIQYAAIRKIPITPTGDLADLLKETTTHFSGISSIPSLTCCVLGYNPTIWELCAFAMFTDLGQANSFAKKSIVYGLHHIS